MVVIRTLHDEEKFRDTNLSGYSLEFSRIHFAAISNYPERRGLDSPKLHIPYRVWYRRKGDGTMSHTINDKKELILRAKRIQGQVEALVRALDEERDCSEVLQLMSAARGAMNSLMAELLEGHIRSHVLNGRQKPTSDQVVAADEVIAMVKSYLK
jgi:DNA-binding FrmR family transcriptional regulator